MRPDPRLELPAGEYEAQLVMALDLRDTIDRVVADVERVRAMREQARDLEARLADDERAEELVTAARRLAEGCDALEARLHNPRAEVVYDILSQPGGTQLHSNLVFLYQWALQFGDGAPTAGVREEATTLAARFAELRAELEALEAGPLADLERLAGELALPRILLP